MKKYKDMDTYEKRALLQTLDAVYGHNDEHLEIECAALLHQLKTDLCIPDELLISVRPGHPLHTLWTMWDTSIQDAISSFNCITLEERQISEFFRDTHRIIPRAIIRDDTNFLFLELTDKERNKQPGRLTLCGGHMRVGSINETLFEACRRNVYREITEELESPTLYAMIADNNLITKRTMRDFVFINDEPVSCRNYGVIFDIRVPNVYSIRTKEPDKHTTKIIKISEIHNHIHEVDPWFRKILQYKPYIKEAYRKALDKLSSEIKI